MSLEFHLTHYERYRKEGIDAHRRGDPDRARFCLLKSAEHLFSVARSSEGRLKEERARRAIGLGMKAVHRGDRESGDDGHTGRPLVRERFCRVFQPAGVQGLSGHAKARQAAAARVAVQERFKVGPRERHRPVSRKRSVDFVRVGYRAGRRKC